MVKQKTHFTYKEDGTLDICRWLETVSNHFHISTDLLKKTCFLTEHLAAGFTTFYNKPTLEAGLEVAEILFSLGLDEETGSAGILSTALITNAVQQEKISVELNDSIVKLIKAVYQIDLVTKQQSQHAQIDKLRKMLLAIATDIRAVIIKLAERLSMMRSIKSLAVEERKKYAQEILDIYAPLANRLGIGQLKWELEDLAFHYSDPETYKTIAQFLNERRSDREIQIQHIIQTLKDNLKNLAVNAEISGRAKHIYSIYLKSQRKELNYQEIYDCSAVRILVPNIEDCYTVLSIVHSLWPPIMQEFDDYIANPKPNGYRSIHTAVVGENGKHFEIQIRTFAMHEEAERGVAAHWLYKENKPKALDDAAKISYLRQLLDWHKDIAKQQFDAPDTTPLIDDQVYVITPAGDIVDLPHGATPLDFAYHIHSELGHRCRGAKVNGQIVPLTYTLRTGDRIELTTILQGTPSRDWLNSELNYLKTSRARNKVAHWFKQQAFNEDIAAGRQILEKEFSRHAITKSISLQTIARHFQLKTEDALLASLGRGNVRIGQILQFIQPKTAEKPQNEITIVKPIKEKPSAALQDAAYLLTRMAQCCKPIPGDDIVGYITQGRGVSIHKKNCKNIMHINDENRLMPIHWNEKHTQVFRTDLKIITVDEDKILNEITALFVNEKISLIQFRSNVVPQSNQIHIMLTIQIENSTQLQKIFHRLQQLPGIITVERAGR